MPKPVTVAIDVPQTIEHVYDFLDVLANHEAFNDHLLTHWQLSGPPRGVGATAVVHSRAMGVSDVIEIVVTQGDAPTLIVERNTARKAGRVGQGTYRLRPTTEGGTHIEFEYRWLTTPLIDRLTAPLARSFIRRNNATAMTRLRDLLAAG